MKELKLKTKAMRSLVAGLTLRVTLVLTAAQVDIPGPAGGSFGIGVHALPNGNFVVVDSSYFGSVSLYDPAGILISRLSGSRFGDAVGSNGVVVLTNGNFVVCSPHWSSDSAERVGAVTWVDGSAGLNGVVSASNSLTGTQQSDHVGSENGASGYGPGAFALANGNYVVRSTDWDNGAIQNAGAITWGNGATGTIGPVSPANSLVGSQLNDLLGRLPYYVTPLTNGNYVVASSTSLDGGGGRAGAIIWGNGLGGTTGPVSENNALFGAGSATVTALANGNYVICSPHWSDGSLAGLGAVTWADGSGPILGEVSPANSLVGSRGNDNVGNDGVQPLTNGNFVVRSRRWNGSRGAFTFGHGSSGVLGVVSAANSLVGRKNSDSIGNSVTALANGHYVVACYSWRNDADNAVGAVTWGNGTTGTQGEISSANSLVGGNSVDFVSDGGVTALANGNYVVNSPRWRPVGSPLFEVGAVTFCTGDGPTVGQVTAENSLTGSKGGDAVGGGGVCALTNGNYVVGSPNWQRNGSPRAGAVTWGSGVSGISGPVLTSNSATGTGQDQRVGSRITALSQGSYVVSSPYWSRPGASECGAITCCEGSAPYVGTVTMGNSIVGDGNGEQLGMDTVVPTADGNYVIRSRKFGLADIGAIALGSGTAGQAGTIGSGNAVIGAVADRGFRLIFTYDPKFRQMVVGHPLSAKVSLFSFPMTAPAEFSFEDGLGLQVRLRAESGKSYLVQHSTNLDEWTPGMRVTASMSGMIYLREQIPAASSFYRLVDEASN